MLKAPSFRILFHCPYYLSLIHMDNPSEIGPRLGSKPIAYSGNCPSQLLSLCSTKETQMTQVSNNVSQTVTLIFMQFLLL